jgi:hypothetical protein
MYSNYSANYRSPPVQQTWYPAPPPKPTQITCLSILAEPTPLERSLERSRQPRYHQQYEPGFRRPQSPYQGYYSPPSVNTSPVAGWQLVQQQNTSSGNVRYPRYNYSADNTTSESEMMSDWEMVGTEV